MPKITDYPRSSLRSSLQLAEAVSAFGGACSDEMAAEKLGKKTSGAFSALIGAAVKYGLVTHKSGRLSVSGLFKEYSLAYSDEEGQAFLLKAFLTPTLFKEIFDRFQNQKLPISHFEKMLVREFEVPSEIASRVSGYFLDGAKQVGILIEGDILKGASSEAPIEDDQSAVLEKVIPDITNQDVPFSSGTHTPDVFKYPVQTVEVQDHSYTIDIRGPGMNVSMRVKEADDLEIVQVMLRKIEKAL